MLKSLYRAIEIWHSLDFMIIRIKLLKHELVLRGNKQFNQIDCNALSIHCQCKTYRQLKETGIEKSIKIDGRWMSKYEIMQWIKLAGVMYITFYFYI